MKSFKRWLLSVLLAGFLAMTIIAAVGTHQNRVEVEEARGAVLGTLICKKTGEGTWAGSTKLSRPYAFAHGVTLIQPKSDAEPWKTVTVRGTFRGEEANASFEFEESGDFWGKEGRNEFFLSHPMEQGGTLSVDISGVKAVDAEKEFKLDVANMLCGCEELVGDFLAVVAWGSSFLSMVLAFFTVMAFARRKAAEGVQAS